LKIVNRFFISHFFVVRFAALALAGAGCDNETPVDKVTENDKTPITKQQVDEHRK
jgi:hypothetical protein